ncbi:radical SAM protein [Candidatus Wolfebacteria bacterium]|nr:radical SAM protein [Candidatus Wolfebacteria bacterium]
MSEITSIEAEKRNRLKTEKPRVYEKTIRYKEKVERGESIAIIQFQYRYECNFTCEHCSIKRFQTTKSEKVKDQRRFFTIPDVKELFRQADEMGLANMTITGGEPLIFPDMDKLVGAIDPAKFHIACDSNGWLLDEKKARHLKSIGIDRMQISLDNFYPHKHDEFRHKDNSYQRIMRAIDASINAGFQVILQTVLTKHRASSQEFLELLDFAKSKEIGVYVCYAKPVGAYEGNMDCLITQRDADRVRELEKEYNVFTHMTPSYGLDLGCITVKRMVSITRYGDVMPCPYIHVSLGNFFQEPLKDIIERGMRIKWFGEYHSECILGENRQFIDLITKNIKGKPLPISYKEVFKPEDFM